MLCRHAHFLIATPPFTPFLCPGRSLSACSAFGWVAGVGDRHCKNLLFEDATGTLVPIDFGYSFGSATSVSLPPSGLVFPGGPDFPFLQNF